MKKILCLMLTAILLFAAMITPTAARVVTGRAFVDEAIYEEYNPEFLDEVDNLTEMQRFATYYQVQYTLDTDSGLLEIYCGTDADGNVKPQEMMSYARRTWVPWLQVGQYNKIEKAVLKDGIGSLGRYTFWGAINLKEIYLPHSVKQIDRTAVYQCPKLETVYYAGNEADFLANVRYDEVRNWQTEDGTTTGEIVYKLYDKIHFGESVTVNCLNQEGEIAKSYTVGGYFPGDEFSIIPQEYDGMTYVGEESEITGKFKKGDSRVYTLQYECDHEYVVKDPEAPCGSMCKHCRRADPNPTAEHEWEVYYTNSERGMLSPLDRVMICENCGMTHDEYAQPYMFYIGIGLAAAVIVTAVTLAIVIPVRRRKRLREMTW